jgi:ankyrin repeat protein
LSHGADPNIANKAGQTALHQAVVRGDQEIVKLLLNTSGININQQDASHGMTALHLAVLFGHQEIIQLLLAHGANMAVKTTEGKTAVELASTKKMRKYVRSVILKRVHSH